MTVNEVVSTERKLKKKKATALIINPRLQRRSGMKPFRHPASKRSQQCHRKRRRYHEKTRMQWIQSHPHLKKKGHEQHVDAHRDKANPSGGVSQRKRRDAEERQIEKRKARPLFPPNKQNQDDNSAKKLNADERSFARCSFCAVASASKSKEILNAKVIVPGKSKGSFEFEVGATSRSPLPSGGSK